jgi:Spermine/spermidine synthase domain
MIFLFVTLFVLSLSVLLFELTLTRIFSIVLWYDYAFMAISVAFFGLGIGALLIHILKDRIRQDKLPSKILQSIIVFAVSLPIFLFIIGHVIPSNTSYIYLFYLASSIPFFFAGISMALIYLTMPKEISKLYFVDLVGAATAALILDPLMRILGAESALISIALLVIGPSLIAALIFIPPQHKKDSSIHIVIENKIRSYAFIVFVVSAILLATNAGSTILAIQPGEIKGLHYQLTNPSIFKHLSTQWNSFSRIDVTKQMSYHNNSTGRSKTLAQIAIDADADTPVFKWNGSISDIQWLKNFMDYMPYEISNANNSNTLVIGSGGGEDILVALAGGSKNVTAVELNPLIISAAKRFGGSSAGNLYDRKDVHLFIDDGRRFISSTNSKYDKIVIKLVDSWAAQLAGGYALSENYLYTVEAFKQYLQHLNGNNGMLVMVRWNIELPRLIPLVVESLRQEKEAEGKRSGIQDISKQILVVEDRPGLFFGSNDQRTVYPVLVIVKNSPFTSTELELAKERIVKDNAKVIIMPGGYKQPPYDSLLSSEVNSRNNTNNNQKRPISQVNYDPQHERSIFGLRPPIDDSPFYFAKELIPNQMKLLLETVVGVSVVLCLLLIYYSRIHRIQLTTSTSRKFHILFVVLIGFGFIFFEITFIQKFLLLLGTPIMALTVILFSILLSSGIGAYLSGRLFNKHPYKAVLISIPILAAIVLIYYNFLSAIIDRSIILELYQRIALTVMLLSPAGLLMGFQFPSITRMASSSISLELHISQRHDKSNDAAPIPTATAKDDITLLWGINVIASVVGTVLAAISSMVIGFNGNLLIGLGLYLGALTSALFAARFANNTKSNQEVLT